MLFTCLSLHLLLRNVQEASSFLFSQQTTISFHTSLSFFSLKVNKTSTKQKNPAVCHVTEKQESAKPLLAKKLHISDYTFLNLLLLSVHHTNLLLL